MNSSLVYTASSALQPGTAIPLPLQDRADSLQELLQGDLPPLLVSEAGTSQGQAAYDHEMMDMSWLTGTHTSQ